MLKYNFLNTLWMMLMSNFLFMFLLYNYMYINNLNIMLEWKFLITYMINFKFVLILDFISLMFMITILWISSLIMLYSMEYMIVDILKHRFFYMIFMFVLSMMLLVLSPNLLSILLGWDGLGLTSFMLVIHYQNDKSLNAGILTILSNRVGDVTLLLSISIIFVNNIQDFYHTYNLIILSIMLMLSGMTKSAQIPFSAWLPAAMAAPTPVSALVHSSTLVTAGVYLLIRFYSFILNYFIMLLLLSLSLYTMLLAGLSAITEFDLKKIVALSTLSQLGLMMLSISQGNLMFTFYHLVMHAFFKSMLFMCSGYLIHINNSVQDVRLMGKTSLINCFIVILLNVSNLSLMAVPFSSGFFSKHSLVNFTLSLNLNLIYLVLFSISFILTSWYSVRLTYYSVFKMFSSMALSDLEAINMMIKSILIHFFMVLFSGIIFSNHMENLINFYYTGGLDKFIGLIFIIGFIIFFVNMNLKGVYFFYTSKMWYLTKLSTLSFSWLSTKMSILSSYYELLWMEYKNTGIYKSINMMSSMMSFMQLTEMKFILTTMMVGTMMMFI
uniref:NADH:ubiquinone reductase (H(+)-translocating) n=1 Tax=Arisubathynella cheongmiensis TaxID=2025387 RepID=A0A7R6D8C1_9CRUS|nr:NADH dehydrogenase subunit 5 [Arisubathynella cheongmiensis]